MTTAINIQLLSDDAGGELARTLPYVATNQSGREAANVVINEIARLAGGSGRGRMRLQVDSTAGVAATITLTCTNSSATAGDALYIGGVKYTAVAATADPSNQTYSTTTGSDNAYAASIAAAINTGRDWSAVSSTNTVIITARQTGAFGNAIAVQKVVTTAGTVTFSGAALASGVDAGARTTLVVTCGAAGTNGQIFTIGNVTLTLAASAANENQVTNGGSANDTAVNLAAAIAAHTRLRGILTCSTPAAGVFTVTCLEGARIGALISATSNITSLTFSGSGAFATTATSTRVTDGFDWPLGAP